jgi:hypothetical protein
MVPDLDADAVINIRLEPHFESHVVGMVKANEKVLSVGMRGDWARLQSDQFGDAWIITCAPDRQLLVPVGAPLDDLPNAQQKQQPWHLEENHNEENRQINGIPVINSMDKHLVAPSLPPPQLQTPLTPLDSHNPGGLERDRKDGVFSPSSIPGDSPQTVSADEYNKLHCRVMQLEADMRALRLLLRSWSLDTPSQSF